MYLKKSSGYDFAPAIVKTIEMREHGATVNVVFTKNDLKGWIYTRSWEVLSENVRKPKIKEILQVPLKYYFKRRVGK